MCGPKGFHVNHIMINTRGSARYDGAHILALIKARGRLFTPLKVRGAGGSYVKIANFNRKSLTLFRPKPQISNYI
jgi:hypothetical protein